MFCEMFLCFFFLHAGRKDFTHRPKVLPPPPPSPSPSPCTMLARHELTIVPKRVKWFANWWTLIRGLFEDWQMASISFRHYCKATHYHLLYWLFIGPNWMALGQPAPSDNFVVIAWPSCSEFSEIVLADPFFVTKCPGCVYFFSRSQKNNDNITCESTLGLQTA